MSRNSSGTYSLPAGNPVVTGTPIAISWANNTLNDIASAMTDSLSRTGDGGMSVGLEGFDGTVSLPGYAFASELSSGVYRVGAGSLGVSILGSKVAGFVAAGLTVTGTVVPSGIISAPVGSAAAPSYTFTGDLDTGMSAAVADTLVLATGGTARLTIDTAGVVSTLPVVTNGAVGTPGFTFLTDLDTGMYRAGANIVGFAANGARSFQASEGQVQLEAGLASAPALMFRSDIDTGIWNVGSNSIGLATGGTTRLTVADALITAAVALQTTTIELGAASDTTIARMAAGRASIEGLEIGYKGIPQNIQNLDYTCVLADAGKHIYKASGGAGETITIPAEGSVNYDIGTVLTFINQGTGTLSIAITTDVMQLSPGGTTGTRTLADDGMATAIKVASALWMISGTGLT